MQPESAENLARDVVIWLAGEEDLLPVFMNATGSDAASVRKGMHDPQFLGAVLDFLLMDDRWIVGFCDAQGVAYDLPQRARAVLPGGEAVHWT